jgi:hypothetical protein
MKWITILAIAANDASVIVAVRAKSNADADDNASPIFGVTTPTGYEAARKSWTSSFRGTHLDAQRSTCSLKRTM